MSKQKERLLIYLADSNTNKILPKKIIIIKIIIAAIKMMWMVTMKETRMIKITHGKYSRKKIHCKFIYQIIMTLIQLIKEKIIKILITVKMMAMKIKIIKIMGCTCI